MRIPSFLVLLSLASCGHGAVVVAHEYNLGENGSLAPIDRRPIDAIGSADFVNAISGSDALPETNGVFAPSSTTYLNVETGTSAGWYGADFSSLPTDNFGMGVYARASQLIIGDIFTTGGGAVNGAFKLSLDAQGWAASAHNVSWIGTFRGTPGSFNPNEWVHLSLIRQNGVATFYIDGVAQGNYAGVPQMNEGHLAVSPGARSFFQGHLDEARIVTFDSDDSTLSILSGLQTGVVPEPSSISLLLLGVLGFVRFRRR